LSWMFVALLLGALAALLVPAARIKVLFVIDPAFNLAWAGAALVPVFLLHAIRRRAIDTACAARDA